MNFFWGGIWKVWERKSESAGSWSRESSDLVKEGVSKSSVHILFEALGSKPGKIVFGSKAVGRFILTINC